MRAEPAYPDITELLRPLSEADIFARPSSAVRQGALRLEAGFYGSEGFRALQAMEKSGFDIVRIRDLAHVKWFGPFSRTYVEDSSTGLPFLTSSTMLNTSKNPEKFISKALTKDLQRLLIAEGVILVSCSGTIGNVAICSKDLDGYAVSQDAIRIQAKRALDRGLIYAFLLSELGQFLVTRNKSGSVIEHLYALDVENLPLPLLPKALRQELSDAIQEASDLRVAANALLDKAIAAVAAECDLPPIESFSVGTEKNVGAGTAYTVSSAERLRFSGGFGCLRLDATFYEPKCGALRRSILRRTNSKTLSQVTRGIYRSSLRARNFVDEPELGVPMIGGKQLTHWRPSGIKYLSKLFTRNLEIERIVPDSTLVTCGGTIGRVLFAHKNYEGWMASEHIMKLVPNREEVWPGFLYAFLASPFGQVQVDALMHGSVIPQVRDFEFGSVAIVLPVDKGKRVHDLVVEAYDHRATAKSIEDDALKLFADSTKQGRATIEKQWGKEY